MWNVDTGSSIAVQGHHSTVCSLYVDATDRHEWLFSTGYDGTVCVWDVKKASAL